MGCGGEDLRGGLLAAPLDLRQIRHGDPGRVGDVLQGALLGKALTAQDVADQVPPQRFTGGGRRVGGIAGAGPGARVGPGDEAVGPTALGPRGRTFARPVLGAYGRRAQRDDTGTAGAGAVRPRGACDRSPSQPRRRGREGKGAAFRSG
ncbi:hypothetical protein GCM10020256_71700 [Streptomyces thermocoprophilus]